MHVHALVTGERMSALLGFGNGEFPLELRSQLLPFLPLALVPFLLRLSRSLDGALEMIQCLFTIAHVHIDPGELVVGQAQKRTLFELYYIQIVLLRAPELHLVKIEIPQNQ